MAQANDPFSGTSDGGYSLNPGGSNSGYGGGYVPPAPAPPTFGAGYGGNQLNDSGMLPPVTNPFGNDGGYSLNPGGSNGGYGQPSYQSGGGGGGLPPGPGGGGQIPWSQIFDTSLGNRSLDQQQQYLDYMLKNYYPWAEQLQSDITKAQMTGDYQGAQTLQAQLQNMQLNMQNLQNGANFSGMYNGSPTMQFQEIQNQYAQSQDLQRLQARGQDEQMAQVQAQIAQSPLIGWYTARGLPPPQSALIGSLGQFDPTKMNWTENNSPPAIGQLPVNGLQGPTYTPPSTPQITNVSPTGGGYQTRSY